MILHLKYREDKNDKLPFKEKWQALPYFSPQSPNRNHANRHSAFKCPKEAVKQGIEKGNS
jgi:hypothetical protein